MPDILESLDQENPTLLVSRWKGSDRNEHSFEIAGEYHILAVALQPTRFALSVGSKGYPQQDITPGAIQITPPGMLARAVHSKPYDILHLHIPNRLLRECFEWVHGKPTNGVVLRDPLPARDVLVQRLGTTLLSIDDGDIADGSPSAEFLCLAIVTHILRQYGEAQVSPPRGITGLPKWRLKLAIEFIEMHLSSRLALADVARAAGLSRMHFAAQFRTATGIRPHEYVLRRRIEKAQIRLATTNVPIAELALEVGFSSQAHFTVVFKRISGLTPHRWRQSHRS